MSPVGAGWALCLLSLASLAAFAIGVSRILSASSQRQFVVGILTVCSAYQAWIVLGIAWLTPLSRPVFETLWFVSLMTVAVGLCASWRDDGR